MMGDLYTAVADLKENEAVKMVENSLNDGGDPYKMLESSRMAMGLVGDRFAEGTYFIPDLIYAGEILKRIGRMVKPSIEETVQSKRLSKILIGTVAGDIHDIGKDLVVFMMDISGFEVIDLGVDVPPETFVERIKEVKPHIVGLSGLLTLAFDSMKKTIESIESAGLRENVKIMIGGCQIDDKICAYTGADAFAPNAVAGTTLAKEWMQG